MMEYILECMEKQSDISDMVCLPHDINFLGLFTNRSNKTFDFIIELKFLI